MKRFSTAGLLLIIVSVVISACGPGQFLDPTLTPSPTSTKIPTITPTSTFISTNTPTITPTPTPPLWLNQLSSNPIVPGTGLAGVKVGDTEGQILTALGSPYDFVPVADANGNVMFYSMMYEYKGIFLGVYLTTEKTVRSFRLHDEDFNKDGLIPNVENIGIGNTVTQLVQAMGQPYSTYDHDTCPQTLIDQTVTTYYYVGVSFWVCKVNQQVYLIDIP